MGKSLRQMVDSGEATVAAPPPVSGRRSLRDLVASGEAQASTAQPKFNELESGLKGAEQGATLGFADELHGNVKQLLENISNTPGDIKSLLSGEKTFGELTQRNLDTYRKARDAERENVKRAQADNPKSYLAGEIGGGLAVPVPGAGVRTLGGAVKTGLALGSATGLGSSEADLTRGDVGGALVDTGIGGGLGIAGGAGGHVIGAGAGYLAERAKGLLANLGDRANRGIREAAQTAEDMAAKKEDKIINSLRGEAGAEVQKASRMSENIRRIPGSEDLGNAAAQARQNRAAAKAALQKAEELERSVGAAGVGDVIDQSGALVSKGSKAADALKGREKIAKLRAFADQAMEHADDLERGFANPADGAGIKAMREAALQSPELAAIENQVLMRNMEDLPLQKAAADSAQGAYRKSLQDRSGNIAKSKADLLGGKAALEALLARVKRYGPPMVGSLVGATMGGPLGAAAGMAAGVAAGKGMEALAGAGMRPALRSWINLFTKYPAVQNTVWQGVKKLAQSNPAALGPYAARLEEAAARSPELLEQTHRALLQDPGYLLKVAELFAPPEGEERAQR